MNWRRKKEPTRVWIALSSSTAVDVDIIDPAPPTTKALAFETKEAALAYVERVTAQPPAGGWSRYDYESGEITWVGVRRPGTSEEYIAYWQVIPLEVRT